MSTRSEKAAQALSRFGELAWFKLPTEHHKLHGYHQVAHMGWRYRAPTNGIAVHIEDVVDAVPTQVAWTLDRTRRNWLLVPSRIAREAGGLEGPSFADIVHSINTQDQEFCLKTLSDLDLIVRRLEASVGQ
ncbi:hypothetical protein ABT272_13665 [Streptomyces sp900105245]|uniref:Uncharacterized protein n=1 Tax=Streptomyces sp. 900105245 TaxID=3154379 RepID=A0ABV1U6A2_9ACTN